MFSQYLALAFKEMTFNYHMYVFTNKNVVIKQYKHRVWNVYNHPNLPYLQLGLVQITKIGRLPKWL